MKREVMFSDHLVRLKEAPEFVGRSRSTVYRWIAQGRVKVIRPTREKWVFVADLRRAERETGGRGLR